MNTNRIDDLEVARHAMDIIPAVLFVVDEDVRLLYANSFGESLIGSSYQQALHRRTGDILECSHSFEGQQGCGSSTACTGCVLRNSVAKVFSTDETIRHETTMTVGGTSKKVLTILMTAGLIEISGHRAVMLYLEDIGELVELRKIIPVCMKCGKIHLDDGSWQRFESYIEKHLGVDMSHSLCDTCLEKFYPAK